MTDFRRFRHPGATWFFTVNLAERRGNRLLVDHIDNLRESFVRVKKNYPFVIEAIVVLPEHLHCILSLPRWGILIFQSIGA
jgi:putative transposase